MFVCILGLTLQFGIHGDVREAAQHCHDLIVLLLPQEAQHAASVRVLETHQVLKGPDFILKRRGPIELYIYFYFFFKSPKCRVCVCSRYLLGDAVAEVLLLKVGQL